MAIVNKKTGLVGTVILMIGLATATLAPWEGKRNDPYADSVGVPTVCYGETRVEMRHYSDAECAALLQDGAQEFAEAVRIRNPRIVEDPHQWAAHASFAYNVGIAAYDRSSVARLYGEGKEREACEFLGRYVYAGGRKLQGLINRRRAETKLCLEDAT